MSRDPWFDNAKMTLVTLVVVGHAWTLLPEGPVRMWLYDSLYLWHVPAFVFVTGFLSRSFTWSRRRLWQLVRTVAVPYLLFECALALFRVYVGGERLEDLFADPHWPMWYLSALFFWRLMTPVFTRMPGAPYLPTTVAVGLSLGAGLWAGNTLDMARVFGLLPFFVLGLMSTPERLERLRTTWVRRAAVAVFVLVGVLAATLHRWGSTEWLYYRSRYVELDSSDLQAVATRALLLVVGTLAAWAFLSLVPRTGGWFARMGAATLVVYLFHGFAVKSLAYAGYPGWADDHAAPALVLTTIGAVGLALLLAWAPVSSRLDLAVDPLGHAERHAKHAVDLHMTGVADGVVDPRGVLPARAPVVEQAIAAAGDPVPDPPPVEAGRVEDPSTPAG